MADYEALDLAEVQTEYARVNAEPGTFQKNDDWKEKFVQLPERDGYVVLRFLPRKRGGKLYCATRVHTLTNPSAKDQYGKPKKRTYHCPKVLVQTDKGPRWQGDCIVCKYYSDLWQKSEKMSGKMQEDLQNQARDIKPVERYYYNVIVRSEKDKEGNTLKNVGPKIFSCGKTTHAKIMRAIVGDESAGEAELGDITHPTDGRDFRVVKKITKGGGGKEYPNYDQSKFENPAAAGTPDELSTWMENIHDLQTLRVVKTDEELRHALKVHLGMVKELDGGDDDDLEEFRNAGTPTSTSAPTASSATASSATADVVREELLTGTTDLGSTSSPENELLADDEFMRELGSM